jgi:hypothetical protein
MALCLATSFAGVLTACGGSGLIKVGNANGAFDINFNVNRGDLFNRNGSGGPPGNDNANGISNFNANGGLSELLPAEFQGEWSVSGDCATFTMTVMPDGSIEFDPLSGPTSLSGTVLPSGAFNITVMQVDDDPVPPGEPPGQCTSRLTGELNISGQVFGDGTRQCTGDILSTPCQFVMLRR